MKVCSICGNKHWAKGYCIKHYRLSPIYKAIKQKYHLSIKGKLKEKEYYEKTKLHQFELKKKYRLLPEVQEKERLRARKYYWSHQKERLGYAKVRGASVEYKEHRKVYRKLFHVRKAENECCKKYKRDVFFRSDLNKLSHYFRVGLRKALLNVNGKKESRTFELLGYSVGDLKLHLESQFRDGMSWENYGTLWHIDHKVPISFAKSRAEVLELYALDNLQPLEASVNCSKANHFVSDLFGIDNKVGLK